jgi:NAD(P)H-nitrite reductase large subunit
MKTSHLIVGAGPAGLSAIDTIREFGDTRAITLVCDEPPYSRMVLPYYMDGTIPEENVFTASDAYLADKGVEALIGKRATAIDKSSATLDDGSTIDFDDALIATGSSAVRPPIPGVDGEGVFNLWTLSDAKAVLEHKGGEVVVIGAGFIAFTCLDAVLANSSKVTVVEVEDRILPRMIDATGAAAVQSWLEKKGVAFLTGAKVTGIEDSNGRKKVALQSGQDLQADLVVTATGIRPNTDLVEGSGVGSDFGILVDDHLRTSVAGVYAGGDIAQGPVVGNGTREVHAIQPTALEHGRIAGANMAGQDVPYWGSLLMNIVDVQKLQIASFGDWAGDGKEVRTVLNETRPVYRKLVFEDDVVVGAVFLGRPDDVAMLNDMGMVKGLIQTRAPLKEWRKYLDRNPLDVRRPYVASRAAEKLLAMKLLGRPSSKEGFRRPDPAPAYWPHHRVFVDTIPD